MRRILYAALAACAMLMSTGATYAQECTLEAEVPELPDGSTATAEQVEEAKGAILAYQKALAPYRECLDTVIKNPELEQDVRQAALDKFNASVDKEKALVENWQKMMAAYEAQ